MIRLEPDSMAHRGAAIARVDGKAHFVAGAMPGEIVEGAIVQDKGSWARVELARIIEPSPDRVEPLCPHFTMCGGCDWQFAARERQIQWKRDIVTGQLRHLGRIEEPDVRDTVVVGTAFSYRNRMDFAVADGRPALHRRATSVLEPIERCHLLLPELADLFDSLGDLGAAGRITIRMGATTGEKHVIVEGGERPSPGRWDATTSHVTESGTHRVDGTGTIHEQIRGNEYQISGRAFFQANTDAIPVLIDLAAQALEPRPGETLLDAYAGGGVLGISLAPAGGHVVAVESGRLAIKDLRHNLAASGVGSFVLVEERFERSAERIGSVDIAVADPPRSGLGRAGVDVIAAMAPRRVAYVSCDPAALGRDTALLAAQGYDLMWATPVDLFPQTFHIETVAAFTRR